MNKILLFLPITLVFSLQAALQDAGQDVDWKLAFLQEAEQEFALLKATASWNEIVQKLNSFDDFKKSLVTQKDKNTMLFTVTFFNCPFLIQFVLDKGAEINALDGAGKTPLHWAAENGHTRIVQLLIDKGANIDAQDDYGSTPLHVAAQKKHSAAVQILLKNGANTTLRDKSKARAKDIALAQGSSVIVALFGEEIERGECCE